MEERHGDVTFKGNPMTACGPVLSVGDDAPDFTLLGGDMSDVTLADTSGLRLFNVVPSLDTPICADQTARFNTELAAMEGVNAYVISVDLPFAQKRVCGDRGVERIKTLSDHRALSFGAAYGCIIKELRFLQRSVFIVGADNKVAYVEYVKEVASHPDYDAALAKLKELSA